MFHFKGVVARIVPVEIDSEIFACWVHLDLGREKWQGEKKGKAFQFSFNIVSAKGA